jgi:hypothetical protein
MDQPRPKLNGILWTLQGLWGAFFSQNGFGKICCLNPMNLAMVIEIYAVNSKELGLPLRFRERRLFTLVYSPVRSSPGQGPDGLLTNLLFPQPGPWPFR